MRHGLKFEGSPHDADGNRIGWMGVGGPGYGVCACGATSGYLLSGSARKRWHRRHKAAQEADLTDSEPTGSSEQGTWMPLRPDPIHNLHF